MSRSPAPDFCAVCGATIPTNSLACPECGADERTGWREQDIYDGLDLPDEESEAKPARTRFFNLWTVTGLVMVVLFIILIVRGHW